MHLFCRKYLINSETQILTLQNPQRHRMEELTCGSRVVVAEVIPLSNAFHHKFLHNHISHCIMTIRHRNLKITGKNICIILRGKEQYAHKGTMNVPVVKSSIFFAMFICFFSSENCILLESCTEEDCS